MVQQQYGRLEINFSLKKPKTPYKTLAVQECFYTAGPLSTETTEIHRVSICQRTALSDIITYFDINVCMASENQKYNLCAKLEFHNYKKDYELRLSDYFHYRFISRIIG